MVNSCFSLNRPGSAADLRHGVAFIFSGFLRARLLEVDDGAYALFRCDRAHARAPWIPRGGLSLKTWDCDGLRSIPLILDGSVCPTCGRDRIAQRFRAIGKGGALGECLDSFTCPDLCDVDGRRWACMLAGGRIRRRWIEPGGRMEVDITSQLPHAPEPLRHFSAGMSVLRRKLSEAIEADCRRRYMPSVYLCSVCGLPGDDGRDHRECLVRQARQRAIRDGLAGALALYGDANLGGSVCSYCGQVGHVAAYCRVKAVDEASDSPVCFGRFAARATEMGDFLWGGMPKCSYCNTLGHTSADCGRRKQDEAEDQPNGLHSDDALAFSRWREMRAMGSPLSSDLAAWFNGLSKDDQARVEKRSYKRQGPGGAKDGGN